MGDEEHILEIQEKKWNMGGNGELGPQVCRLIVDSHMDRFEGARSHINVVRVLIQKQVKDQEVVTDPTRATEFWKVQQRNEKENLKKLDICVRPTDAYLRK